MIKVKNKRYVKKSVALLSIDKERVVVHCQENDQVLQKRRKKDNEKKHTVQTSILTD